MITLNTNTLPPSTPRLTLFPCAPQQWGHGKERPLPRNLTLSPRAVPFFTLLPLLCAPGGKEARGKETLRPARSVPGPPSRSGFTSSPPPLRQACLGKEQAFLGAPSLRHGRHIRRGAEAQGSSEHRGGGRGAQPGGRTSLQPSDDARPPAASTRGGCAGGAAGPRSCRPRPYWAWRLRGRGQWISDGWSGLQPAHREAERAPGSSCGVDPGVKAAPSPPAAPRGSLDR